MRCSADDVITWTEEDDIMPVGIDPSLPDVGDNALAFIDFGWDSVG